MAQRTRNLQRILIVNADDLGRTALATDAILTCHRERAVTSATAMVYMKDSDRAARLALARELPVGLHINLTSPFSSPAVPDDVRERQMHMIAVLGHSRVRKWIYDIRLQRELDRSLRDQLHRFEELYGRPPTHFDSHHHLHSCPNVFLSRALPGGALIRNTLISSPRRSRMVLGARRARQRMVELRLRSPRTIVCLDVLLRHHGPSGDGIAAAVVDALSEGSTEVMAHPEDPVEFAFLRSETWRQVIAVAPTGSFIDLQRDHRRG